MLFELIAARYERRSMLITANQPFGEWGKIFPDQAMTLAAIDRLVHHATILEMNVESYRRTRSPRSKARPRPASDARDNQENREVRRLIDARRQSKRLPNAAASVNHQSARPPRLILIDAPFSSRLSRYSLAHRLPLAGEFLGFGDLLRVHC